MNTLTFNALGLINIEDFAKMLKTNPRTVRTWKQRGDIPERCFKKVAGTVFVKELEIKQWIEQV